MNKVINNTVFEYNTYTSLNAINKVYNENIPMNALKTMDSIINNFIKANNISDDTIIHVTFFDSNILEMTKNAAIYTLRNEEE